MVSQEERMIALASFLSCDVDDIGTDKSDEKLLCESGNEYLVLTDEEADDRAGDYILDSIWAFRPEFLARHMKLSAKFIGQLQEKNQESEALSECFRNMLVNQEDFIEDAIKADGRGHFLATYDNEEHESCDEDLFIYQVQ